MKNTLLYWLYLSFCLLFIVSCSDSESDSKMEAAYYEPKFRLETQMDKLPQEGGTFRVSITQTPISRVTSYYKKVRYRVTVGEQQGEIKDVGTATSFDFSVSANERYTERKVMVEVCVDKNYEGLPHWGDWKTVVNIMQAGFEQSNRPSDFEWESAWDAVRNMRVGWNLGNTLDANGGWMTGNDPSSYETMWGQPVTKPELMRMLAGAGFGAIRVPVTWYQHMDENTYQVDEAWMNRVEEVVNYVLDEGMYCILNVHHDTGAGDEGGKQTPWMFADKEIYEQTKDKFKALWQQIAERFEKYDKYLLFEAYNEILDVNKTWNYPSVAGAFEAANAYNQDFVDVVRASGPNNKNRNLVLNTYCAGTGMDNLKGFVLPKDVWEDNRLIAAVHSYAPYPFAFDLSQDSYWSEYDTDVFDASCEAEIKSIVEDLNDAFVSQGIPCIMGEFGAADKNNDAERAKQAACYVSEAAKYGICGFYWMGLIDGKDRENLVWSEPLIRDALIEASKEMK